MSAFILSFFCGDWFAPNDVLHINAWVYWICFGAEEFSEHSGGSVAVELPPNCFMSCFMP